MVARRKPLVRTKTVQSHVRKQAGLREATGLVSPIIHIFVAPRCRASAAALDLRCFAQQRRS